VGGALLAVVRMSVHHRKLSSRAWGRLRTAIFSRDGFQCVQCGSRVNLECDHIEALEDGGSNDPENLRTLCRDCHITINAERNRVHHVAGQREWERLLGRSPRRRQAELWRGV